MKAKISKRYFYKSKVKDFKLHLTFLPNGPHILKTEILTIFLVLQVSVTRAYSMGLCPSSIVPPCRDISVPNAWISFEF